MSKGFRTRALASVGALSFAFASSSPGIAQSAPPAESNEGLADIVVTAQKRSENLQNVPIAATAVTGELVDKLQAVSIQGLNGKVPNVQINNFGNTPHTASISIRGIGVIDPDPYAGNTVGIVYDGVPQYFNMGGLVDLYDVERVEVLRGPQGTLFGANTTGGVINVVTAQPSGELGGKAEVTYGNWNRFDVKGAIDFPIVTDVLAGKLVFSHHERDGWVTNVVNGKSMSGRNVELYRGYLRFTPSDNVDATLSGEYVQARNGMPLVISGATPGQALYAAPGTLGMYVGPCQPGRRCNAPDKYLSANSSVPDQSDLDTHRETLTVNISDTPLGDITSITAYKWFKILDFTDQDATVLDLLDTRRATKGWQFSQELRSSFAITDQMNAIAGVYYLKDKYRMRNGTKLTFAGPGLVTYNDHEQSNYSISGFAQVFANLTDKLRVQAGIRYTHEKTSMLASTVLSVNPTGVTDFFGTGNTVLTIAAPPRGRKSWDKIGWKLGVDYELFDRSLFYASWARGFKSGGFAGRLGIAEDIGPFGPETVDTYEAGFKTDLLDRRLRLNVAAFMTDYRDMQIASYYNIVVDGQPVQGNTIINAAKSRIKGFEAELTAIPVPDLTIAGSIAYLDAKYRDFPFLEPGTTVPINLKGERLQNAPKWQATASASYELHLGEHRITPSVSYSYTAEKLFISILDVPRARIQPTHLVDANIEWALPGDRFAVSLWGKNLMDNRYMAAVIDQPIGGFASYAAPREYGVTAKMNF